LRPPNHVRIGIDGFRTNTAHIVSTFTHGYIRRRHYIIETAARAVRSNSVNRVIEATFDRSKAKGDSANVLPLDSASSTSHIFEIKLVFK
jgi:hypothetical protein